MNTSKIDRQHWLQNHYVRLKLLLEDIGSAVATGRLSEAIALARVYQHVAGVTPPPAPEEEEVSP